MRFNFRGVGKSTGSTYFRSPQRECEDVRDICRWLHAYRKHLGEEPLQSVWVAGVSYGSAIGSAAAGLYDEFSGYVAVSYPASYLWYCCNLQGDQFLQYARTPKPKLFLSGDVDVFAGKQATEEVVKSMPARISRVLPAARRDARPLFPTARRFGGVAAGGARVLPEACADAWSRW